MGATPHELARRLAEHAEAVCRRYLSNGHREGRYWLVGDVRNTPGHSMFVRLTDGDTGPAGKWRDAQSGEHGDLLDIIRVSCGLTQFADVVTEARRFLALPHDEPAPADERRHCTRSSSGSSQSARRLFAMSRPLPGTIAETYLRNRGITALHQAGALRFHPRCYVRIDRSAPPVIWPAMIAAVTDLAGTITGVHRTWLDPSGCDKAPIATPRKALGHLLGHGVRFGCAADILAAGEGIETMLSLRLATPALPMIAALSAAHLAAMRFPATLRRLYIARDADPAGKGAAETLTMRATAAGIEAITITPHHDDFNADLQTLGLDELRSHVRTQLVPEDVARFLLPAAGRVVA
jgi:hypothetical protein